MVPKISTIFINSFWSFIPRQAFGLHFLRYTSLSNSLQSIPYISHIFRVTHVLFFKLQTSCGLWIYTKLMYMHTWIFIQDLWWHSFGRYLESIPICLQCFWLPIVFHLRRVWNIEIYIYQSYIVCTRTNVHYVLYYASALLNYHYATIYV